MSIRAYRVNTIEYEKGESFNLWHDDALVDFLEKESGFFDTLDSAGGLTEVTVEVLEKALKEINLDECLKKRLEEDIKWVRKQGHEYVRYYCF